MEKEKSMPGGSSEPLGSFAAQQNEFLKPGQQEMLEQLKRFRFPMGDFAKFLESLPPELKVDAKKEMAGHLESVLEMIKDGTFEERA